MRILIFTQAVDIHDPVLGFFCRWIEEFAKKYEFIEVVCLKEGEHHLPSNVSVHSLGKEHGRSRIKYIFNFYKYIFSLKYDKVFVHMNEEYLLLGGFFWRLMRKRVFMWRNYHAGTFLTDIAAFWCTNVFCTSAHSYTAKYKKTILMPVGVDTQRFFPDPKIQAKPNSILFLSGMWPSKRPEMLVAALQILADKKINFTADFYGSPLPATQPYYESVKQAAIDAGIADRAIFHGGISNDKTPDIYRSHQIFINCSPSGMFDKTLFEAAACECTVLASSLDFADIAGAHTYFDSAEKLAELLEKNLSASVSNKNSELVAKNSLTVLIDKLAQVI